MGEKIAPGSAAARQYFEEAGRNFVNYLKGLAAQDAAGIQLTAAQAALLQAHREIIDGNPDSGTIDNPLQ